VQERLVGIGWKCLKKRRVAIIDGFLFRERRDVIEEGGSMFNRGPTHGQDNDRLAGILTEKRRKPFVIIMGIDGRQTDLLEVVLALGPVGDFADFLYSGQQHSEEDRNDGDHDEQFDEGKPVPNPRRGSTHVEAPFKKQAPKRMVKYGSVPQMYAINSLTV
jgi:hypothetical protein